MAVVGEATILVKAITTGVAKDIEDGLSSSRVRSSSGKAGDALGKEFGTGFIRSARKDFAKASMAASKDFHHMVRASYYFQSGMTAATQSISAVIGGLGAFAGAAGGAAASGMALANMFAQIKIASIVANSAFSGVSQAVSAASKAASGGGKTIAALREEMQQLAFAAEAAALGEEAAAISLEKARVALARSQDLPFSNMARREAELEYAKADLNYRKAVDKNNDAKKALAKGPAGQSKTDPYAGLTKSQREFAQYLVSVKSQFKQLNEAAASGFFPILTTQIDKLLNSKVFETLVWGFNRVGQALGEASIRLTNSLMSPDSVALMGDAFAGTYRHTMAFADIIANLIQSFFKLYRAAAPVLNIFVAFLSKKTAQLSKDLSNNFSNLRMFFKDAGDTAAIFGKIAGNAFSGIKALILANVGPGSGGRMLLDQLQESTGWMTRLGTAAGAFSAGEYFKAVSQNFLAITSSIAGLMSILKDMGASPDVKLFWDTITQGQVAFAEIVQAATGSAPILAEILVSLTEIIASFTDSGQIKTYLNIISAVFKSIAGFFRAIQPIMKILGPIIGAMGALITLGLLFKKVYMIGFGTVMVAMRAMAAVQAVMLALRYKENIAAGVAQLQNTRLGMTYLAMGGTMKSVSVSANLMWASIAGPIGWVTLALVALAAVIGTTMAINADRAKKSMSALNTEFKDSAKHNLTAADATRQWSAALLTVTDAEKVSINSMDKINAAIEAQNKLRKAAIKNVYATNTGPSAGSAIAPSADITAATAAFKSYGDTLSKIAKKNFPEVQRQYRNFIATQGVSRDTALRLLDSSDDMTKSLEAQANALGDTIYNMDGSVNAQKRLDYAIGEGTYKLALANAERKKFAQTMKNAIQSFIDVKLPLEQSSEDLKKYSDTVVTASGNASFSLTKYKEDLKKQNDDLKAWARNIAVLSKSMTQEGLNNLIAMGKGGAGLVASLVKGTGDSLQVNKKALGDYVKQIEAASKAQADAAAVSAAVTNPQALRELLTKKYGGRGVAYEGAVAAINAGNDSISNIAERYGITLDELIAKQKTLKSSDVAANVNIKGVWDKASLDNLKSEFDKAMGATTYTITARHANGGLIGKISRFASGGIAKFANGTAGGPVSGPGGPRSDMIPAMLSNGEYVVNAASTAKNLALLTAINAGAQPAAPGINMSIYAAPGMNEQEIATLVSNRLKFEMSRGAAL